MSNSKWVIASAVCVAAVAGAFFAELRSNTELMEKVADQTAEIDRLRAENQGLQERMARQKADTQILMSAKNSAAARSGAAPVAGAPSTAAPVSGADKPAPSKVALAPGLTPLAAFAHAGRATPRDAWATQLWAAAAGDVPLEASAITLGPEARAKLEALLPTLPEATRDTYGTPELLLAFALSGSPHPVRGMQVLGETDQDANDATLQTQWQHADDTIVHQNDVQMQQGADGWKMVVPMSIVDRAVAYLSRGAAVPAK